MKRIGLELQKRYRHMLRRPMSWSLIDAFVRLEETEEEAARQHAVQQQSEKKSIQDERFDDRCDSDA
ncbi:MAG: hypothetical protein K2X41_00290 [Hyphomicrobium sp.]|nr:hypothetical protein [Hyphomicrobium sp.]